MIQAGKGGVNPPLQSEGIRAGGWALRPEPCDLNPATCDLNPASCDLLLHELDLTRTPGLVEPGLQRAVHAQGDEP